MNSRDTLSLLAGLGQGYMQQDNVERQRRIEQANIDWQNNLRQRDQAAYDLAQKQRGDLVAAAAPQAPVAVMQKPDTADNIDVGQDTSAAPAATGQYDVNGTPYADQASAAAAAAAANTPTAQMARMAQAYRTNGDPVAAAQLESQARQSQLAQIQLDTAKQEADARKFNAGLTTAIGQGHQAIADFLTKSGGDGHGGQLKAEVVPSADGKTVQYKLTKPDGSTTLTDSFSNDKNGAVEAGFGYQSLMTPAMLAAHNEAQVKDKREQQVADQTGAYQQGMLKNNAERIALMGEAAQARAEAAIERAKNAAQNAKDPVLQAELGITGKQLEQTTETINKVRSADGYDPLKPPPGEKLLLAQQAALQQKVLDLTAGRRHGTGGPPAVFNQPPPHQPPPGFVTPGIAGMPETGPIGGVPQAGAPAAAAATPVVDPAAVARSEEVARRFAQIAPSVVAHPVATMAPPPPAAAARTLTPQQQAIVNGLPLSMRAAATQRYLAGAQ